MNAFRKRFVQINMALIGVVLFIMLGLIGGLMCVDDYTTLEQTMSQVVRPYSSDAGIHLNKGEADGERTDDEAHIIDEEPEELMNISSIFYTPSEDNISVLSRDDVIWDDETLAAILDEVIASEESYGVLSDYGLVYYYTGNGEPYKIALTSTDYLTSEIPSRVALLAGIWIAVMLVFLGISMSLSKFAVRPMEEAMAREKQFVADASHDLKTPLSVILANNSILLENPQATIESQRKWIDSSNEAAKNMQGLIGEMLSLAKAEETDGALTTEDVNISDLVMKTIIQMDSIAYEKEVFVNDDFPTDIHFTTNADAFGRIAQSLIENAIKHEPAGGTVNVQLEQIKNGLVFSVQNTNSVIAAEDLPHVFERFYRGDKSRTKSASSHGLGLAITRQLVERIDGDISVQSNENEGTTFTVLFN